MYNIIRLNSEGEIEFYSISNRRWQRAKTKGVIKLVALGALKTMSEKTAFNGVLSDIGTVNTFIVKDFTDSNYYESKEFFEQNSETQRVFSVFVESAD